MNETKVIYTGVFLDTKSQDLLFKHFNKHLPEGWSWLADHMTITMGMLPEEQRAELIGKSVKLKVVSLGFDDKVMCVGVTGFKSANSRPHITLGVNYAGGGKPVMSNNIDEKNWTDLGDINLTVTGIVDEYKVNTGSINENQITKGLPFYDDIINAGGEIYQVGGAVRDAILGKQSKDLDLLIRGIKLSDLEGILKKHGRVNMVGSSFGVIKFIPTGGDEEIDITIPRTEKIKKQIVVTLGQKDIFIEYIDSINESKLKS